MNAANGIQRPEGFALIGYVTAAELVTNVSRCSCDDGTDVMAVLLTCGHVRPPMGAHSSDATSW